MLYDITQKGSILEVTKVSKNKELETLSYNIPQHEMFEWVTERPSQRYTKDPVYTFWKDNSPVYRKPVKRLNKFRLIEFIEGFDESEKERIFEFNEPPKLFCDIETEFFGRSVKKMMSDPSEAITAIGYFNDNDMSAVVLGTKELSANDIGDIEDKTIDYLKDFSKYLSGFRVEYIKFSTEYDMLNYMFKNVIKKSLVMTGWNFVGFDWAYMLARARRIGLRPEICAEGNRFYGKQEKPKKKLIIDHSEMFHKWSGKRFETSNKSLEEAAIVTLKKGKIKYDGSLQKLYENDFKKYIYYNVVDTMLVYLIDKIDKTFMLFAMIGTLTQIESGRAFSPVYTTEAMLCREFYKQHNVLPWVDRNSIDTRKIEGAFVKQPDVGIHKLVAGLDFASLYPSLMRMFNISPESYLGKVGDLTKEEIKGMSITAMGTVFETKDSVTKKILGRLYAQRKHKKSLMFQADSEINRLNNILKEKVKLTSI